MPRFKPLTNHDILLYAKGVAHFRGVFMKDTLPKKPWKRESGVINLDVDAGPGTHWVAYKKTENIVVYFDSYGNLRPPIEVEKYFKNCTIYFNHHRFQPRGATNCGQMCISFLYTHPSNLLLRVL